jgi:FkbM family methyltransferase
MTTLKIHDKDINIQDIKQFKNYIELVKEGLWEPDTFKVFDAFLDNSHSYIDIGAWLGITSLYGCQKAKHCYAIEPDPVAFQYLKDNVALNPVLKDKLTLSNVCIYHLNGPVILGNRTSSTGGDSESSVCFSDASLTWEVTGTTLKNYIKEHQIKDCNFIKMDIEGAERTVLPTMAALIKKLKPTLYVAIHPLKFEADFEEATLGIIDVLKLYKHVFTAQGLEIVPDVLLNESLKGPSYELVATDLSVGDYALKESEWGKSIRWKSWMP